MGIIPRGNPGPAPSRIPVYTRKDALGRQSAPTLLRRTSKFNVGQLVAHRRLGYRAVVVDVDPVYRDNDAWCESEYSLSARYQPWYRILQDGSTHETYLPELSLRRDAGGGRIRHPLVWLYFSEFRDGAYLPERAAN